MRLLVVLAWVAVSACVFAVGRGQSQDCCQTLGIASECHFLCGSTSISWFSTTTWRCVHQHGAAVASCKINKSIDYVALFGERFSQTIQGGFNGLKKVIKEKIIDISKFATATVDELKEVPQDILSALDTLKEMTVTQFKGLVDVLNTFTTQNLKYLLDNVPLDVVSQNYNALASRDWDKEQIFVIVSTAFKKFGANIEQWTADQFNSLGGLVAGLPSNKLARVSASAFDRSVNVFCQARLSVHQKAVLIIPAESALGKIVYWSPVDIKKMCNLVEGMSPDQLLQLGADNVVAALKDLEKLALDSSQRRALLVKFKESIGKAATWTVDNLKQLGTLINELDPTELSEIAADKIEQVLDTIGDLEWTPAQAVILIQKARETLGAPDGWLSSDLNRLKKALAGLVPSELEKIQAKEFVKSLQSLESVKWTQDQAMVLFEKVKQEINLPQIQKKDLVALGNIIDAFESSDVGKITNVVLLFTFPKGFLIKTVSVAVVRQFIQIYKDNSKSDIVSLGSIANALTRAELNETQIADILGVIGKVVDIEWDEEQVAELFIKVRQELGDVSALESAQSNSPNWGFQSLRQMGKVVTGLPSEELEKFPVRGFEDSVEVMGRQEGWKRGQIIALVKRMREYWIMQNMTLDKLQEVDIVTLGSFLQGVTKKEFESLPEDLLLSAIQQLGQTTGLPEDKVKSRAYSAFNFLHKQTGFNFLNGTDIRSLGNLIVGLGKDAYAKITKEGFLSNLYDIVRKPGMPMDKLREIVDVAKGHFEESDTGKWLGAQWRELGPAVKAMDLGEIGRISKGAFEDVIDELGLMDGWTADQARTFINKAKEFWNEQDVGKWTGEQLRRVGAFVQGLNAREIARIASAAYKDMMGRCAHIRGMERETLKALAQRGKEVFAAGDASSLTLNHLKQLGCAVTGLLPTDLSKLNIANIDIVAELGKHDDWSIDQLRAIANSVKSFVEKNVRSDYLLSLGNIIRAYTPDELEKLTTDAFKQGAGTVGRITDFTQRQLASLAKKAKETWGIDVRLWSRAQISEAGTFLAGLTRDDLGRLANDVIEMIPIRALLKMTREQIAGFSAEQLRRMDSTQVNALTAGQRSALAGSQAAALRAVEDDDPMESDPWRCAGGVCSSASTTQLSVTVVALTSVIALVKMIL